MGMIDIMTEMEAEGAIGMLGFYLVYMLVMLGISVAAYIFQSLGTYGIAKRRGIRHPWLAWLPVGSDWILGCISDQFQYVARNRVKNKRKALLVLTVVLWLVLIAFYVIFFALMFQAMSAAEAEMLTDATWYEMMGLLFAMLGMSAVMMGVSVAVVVIRYIALYDLYTSCEPSNNVLYLVLSIFISIAQPILIFACRNKDLGMPPRRPEPNTYIPRQPLE